MNGQIQPYYLLAFEQLVDVLDMIQRIVKIEVQIGSNAQFAAFSGQEFSDLPGPLFDEVNNRLLIRRCKNAEIDLGDSQIGANANSSHRNHSALGIG